MRTIEIINVANLNSNTYTFTVRIDNGCYVLDNNYAIKETAMNCFEVSRGTMSWAFEDILSFERNDQTELANMILRHIYEFGIEREEDDAIIPQRTKTTNDSADPEFKKASDSANTDGTDMHLSGAHSVLTLPADFSYSIRNLKVERDDEKATITFTLRCKYREEVSTHDYTLRTVRSSVALYDGDYLVKGAYATLPLDNLKALSRRIRRHINFFLNINTVADYMTQQYAKVDNKPKKRGSKPLTEQTARFAVVRTKLHGGGVVSFHNSLQSAVAAVKKERSNNLGCTCGCARISAIPLSALGELEAYEEFSGDYLGAPMYRNLKSIHEDATVREACLFARAYFKRNSWEEGKTPHGKVASMQENWNYAMVTYEDGCMERCKISTGGYLADNPLRLVDGDFIYSYYKSGGITISRGGTEYILTLYQGVSK